MTSNIEKNIDELRRLDYGMDTDRGNALIGDIVAEAYRLFPNDFMRALEHAQDGRYGLISKGEFPDAGDSNVRDMVTETLRMVCTPEKAKPEQNGNADVEGGNGYLFSMALSPVEVDVMISMIDADADNEHDKGEDEGLRSELGASLRKSLVEINGTGGKIIMTPGELDLISMLADNWLATGMADCLRSGPDDFTEDQEQALIEETEATLTALHARLLPTHNPIIVL